jgi:hypothetical protein
MKKNLSKILILTFIFLAGAGLWLVLFFGIPVESFSSFGFLNRYKEWGQSQNEAVSIEASQSSLTAMSNFLEETVLGKKEFEKYFIEGDSGRLLLLTSLEEAGRQLGATTTIVSVAERKGEASFFDITITARGAFESVYRFIRTLESLPFIITVKQGNLRLLSDGANGGVKGDTKPIWEGSFQITVQSFTQKTI